VATDPATESFPAFSPDGKSVAYTRSPGAIYVRALDSAVPTHVNAGLPPGTHPFWAPDGSRVYYSSERTLHSVSSAGGALAKVMDDCRGAALTPDGKALLFARRENGRLIWYTSSPPGAEPKKLRDDLPEVEELGRGNAGFSPDGSKFAILDKTLQGWTVPYPSGTPRRIPGAESGRFLAWFPDSRHMLIHMASNGEGFRLAVVDTKTGARRLVYEGPDPAIAGSVSPDGVRVAYAAGPADLDVIEFGLDGKRLRVLANSSRLDSDADWSPRGDQLVYASGALGGRDLWIRSGDGLRATRLTAGTAGDPIGPRFSPDGRRIAYCSGLALWVMPAEGGRPVSVYSGGARMYSPAWSRDGDWLVVGDRSRLMKVPAGGGKAVPLKQVNMGGHSGVRWSRDGRWIAYFQPGEGLHLVSVDGRQERLLARGPGVTPGGDFTPGSASYVLARRGEDRDWELVVVDVASGRELKSAPLEIDRDDGIWTLSCHPDGRRVAITTGRLRYDIWMIEGFPQPARGWMRLLRHWTQ
jgi:Tol biopolymer transport system component